MDRNYWREFLIMIMSKTNGMKDLVRAVNEMSVSMEFQNLVMEAFTYGQKPPLRLTEVEKQNICRILDVLASNSKKN